MTHLARTLALTLALATGGAQAVVTVYNDRSAWEAAVGAFSQISFDSMATPGLAIQEFGSGHSYGISGGVYQDRLIEGSFTRFALANPTWGFGGSWDLTPSGAGHGLRLRLGEDEWVTPEIANSASGGFFGFTSTNSFEHVYVFAGTQGGVAETYHVDDVVYAAPVPEPSTYALMAAGLFAVGFMARRRMK